MDLRVSLSVKASCKLSAILQESQEAAVSSLRLGTDGQGMAFPGGNLFRSLAGFKAVYSQQNLWEKTMKILFFGISVREYVLELNQ